jgi:hypothetical protein
VLSYLFQVCQRVFLSFHYGGHAAIVYFVNERIWKRLVVDLPTESCSFELFTSVQAVSEFEQPDIIFCYRVDQVFCCSQLTESEFVVVLVVQNIYERG